MVQSVQLSVGVKLVTHECSCGGVYAITQAFYDAYYKAGGSWQCPYCQRATGWGFDTENEKLKRQLAEQRKTLDNERKFKEWAQQDAANMRAERDHKERQRRTERGLRTRLKKRIQRGVCPCCNRSFVNLQRHMAGQHPGFEKLETA